MLVGSDIQVIRVRAGAWILAFRRGLGLELQSSAPNSGLGPESSALNSGGLGLGPGPRIRSHQKAPIPAAFEQANSPTQDI